MNTGFFDARSRMMPTYASLAMSAAGVTSTFCTVRPLICMPRIFVAISFASAGVLASFTPPALPRPPACTCAFTTTVPPNCCAIASASLGRRRDFARRNRHALLREESPSPDIRECSRVLRSLLS